MTAIQLNFERLHPKDKAPGEQGTEDEDFCQISAPNILGGTTGSLDARNIGFAGT